ncbi:uncharacterized protein LOC111323875 [Stylophora pistillata]|uniref:uncharacterized protein LOC111323875 n=1 Tax=Stylophora pistillata TaxID=50429 RepID=UPI000C04614E|nr:uncharacterized protein LOC111323875 [Stylophora pistillata]
MKTVTVFQPLACHWQCVDTPLCFSVNVRKLPSGWVTCELNNSSKTADPQDLIPSSGSQYYQMAETSHCTLEECTYKDALPDGWLMVGSKRIKLFHGRKTWGQAKKFCNSIGGELVSITRAYENEFVANLVLQVDTSTTGEEPYHIIARWFLDGADSDVSLFGGARYEEESGEKSLYLDGSGAHATTPAVDFNKTSFTIASWVKLQTPVNDPSPIYTDWSSNDEIKFLFIASEGKAKELRFGGFNQRSDWKPWLSGGSPPIDQWFQAAAVWDRQTSEVHLFLNSHKVGTQQVASDIFLAETSHTAYDIGLKRDNMGSLRGNLKNLTIISRALSVEEIANISDPKFEVIDGVWIGGNDITTEGTFLWPNGNHVTYTNWAVSQPDNSYGYQDCVAMIIFNGTWDDTSCGRRLPFVCEKQP